MARTRDNPTVRNGPGPAGRRNVDDLTPDELADLRTAFAELKHRSVADRDDPRGYFAIAGHHGVPHWLSPHHTPQRIFLPWNRAHMRLMDQALQSCIPSVTLPWWDWTTTPAIPGAFAEPTVDGDTNPLYLSETLVSPADIRDGAPLIEKTVRDPSAPEFLPGAADLQEVLSRSGFAIFSDFCEGIHDRVHGWVGGTMGNIGYAAFDPIFWVHQCMVDRIWWLWQQDNEIEQPFAGWTDLVLEPFNVTVADTLDADAFETALFTALDDRLEWRHDVVNTKRDELGRRSLATHALAPRLRRLRDEPATGSSSFLVHIDGPWGSGKSTLLQFLAEELEKDFLVVNVNAWRQMGVGPPWLGLLAGLRQAMREDRGFGGRLRLRLAEILYRLRSEGVLLTLALSMVAVAAVVAAAILLVPSLDLGHGEVGKAVALLGGALAVLATLRVGASTAARRLMPESAASAHAYEQSQRDPMESLADLFGWLLQRARKPVLLVVDDLDRCDGDYVVALLDTVQNLVRDSQHRRSAKLARPRKGKQEQQGDEAVCYVIVAADGRWIRASYEDAHKTCGAAVSEPGRPLGYFFLDKIFQMTVSVPAMGGPAREAYFRALVRKGSGHGDYGETAGRRERVRESSSEDQLLRIFREADDAQRAELAPDIVSKLSERTVARSTQHALEKFADLLDPNPRAMIRFVNAYGMARVQHVLQGDDIPRDQLALWTILRVRWPALADYLRAHPQSVDLLLENGPRDSIADDLAPLLDDPDVRAVVGSSHGGPLSSDALYRSGLFRSRIPKHARSEAGEIKPQPGDPD